MPQAKLTYAQRRSAEYCAREIREAATIIAAAQYGATWHALECKGVSARIVHANRMNAITDAAKYVQEAAYVLAEEGIELSAVRALRAKRLAEQTYKIMGLEKPKPRTLNVR